MDYANKLITLKGDNCEIWDTAGEEAFRSISKGYYKGVAGALLVFDLTRRGSFLWVQDYIIDIAPVGKEGMKRILVGNKSDMPIARQVSFEEDKKYADELSADYIETSAKTGDQVNEVY